MQQIVDKNIQHTNNNVYGLMKVFRKNYKMLFFKYSFEFLFLYL